MKSKLNLDALPKYLQRKLRDSKGRILRFEERYHTRYFKADTVEDLADIALLLIIERYGPDGCWGNIRDNLVKPEAPTFTKDSISNLPAELQEAATAEWTKYDKDRIEYECELDKAIMVETTLKLKDRTRALLFVDTEWQDELEEFFTTTASEELKEN